MSSTALAVVEKPERIKDYGDFIVRAGRFPTIIDVLPRPSHHSKRLERLLKLGKYRYCDEELRGVKFGWGDRRKPIAIVRFNHVVSPTEANGRFKAEGVTPSGISSLLYFGVGFEVTDQSNFVVASVIWTHPKTGAKYVPCFGELEFWGQWVGVRTIFFTKLSV